MTEAIPILMLIIVVILYFFVHATVAKVAANLVIIFIFITATLYQKKLGHTKTAIFILVVTVLWIIMLIYYLTTL